MLKVGLQRKVLSENESTEYVCKEWGNNRIFCRHRREIAKYKSATAACPATVKVEIEELQVITEIKEDKDSYTGQTQDGQLDSKVPLEGASETEELKPGDIMVTWKDGNASKLYSDSQEEGEEDK